MASDPRRRLWCGLVAGAERCLCGSAVVRLSATRFCGATGMALASGETVWPPRRSLTARGPRPDPRS